MAQKHIFTGMVTLNCVEVYLYKNGQTNTLCRQ